MRDMLCFLLPVMSDDLLGLPGLIVHNASLSELRLIAAHFYGPSGFLSRLGSAALSSPSLLREKNHKLPCRTLMQDLKMPSFLFVVCEFFL